MRSLPAAFPLLVLLVAPLAFLSAQVDSVDIARLRADVAAHPDSFPLVFALGRALARTAGERESDWRQRLEARKVLDKAYGLRPDDPRPFLEIGLLLRKQGMTNDAERTLRRAEQRAQSAMRGLDSADQADLHYELGLISEVTWEDGEHLGQLVSGFAVGSCSRVTHEGVALARHLPSAASMGLIAYNFLCPSVFREIMANWRPLNLYETDFTAMIEHFRRATRLDPSHTDAAFHLLQHLAAAGWWEEYLETAEWLARRLPQDPSVLLFLGLGYHETGRADRADSTFTAALDLASPALREELLDPQQLFKSHDSVTFGALGDGPRAALGDVFWRARDPLYLTPGNERLAEHLSRLAYVEVAYSAPQSGVRGRFTDRGGAWLRYGGPQQIRAIRSGDGEMIEFWDYGGIGPNLVFQRHRRYRWARSEENTGEYLRYARERVPELYAPAHPRIVANMPFQAVVFRRSDGGSVLEVYGALPRNALRDATSAPQVETGVFVVTGDFWESRSAIRHTTALAGPDTLITAAFPLDSGSYVVSLEAEAGDVAARLRQRVDVPSFGTGLSVSDLLLVEGFGAQVPQPDDRRALEPIVTPTRVFPTGHPLGVVWEIYGLQPDSTGVAHYSVKAEVADAEHHNAVVTAVGAGEQGTQSQWDQSRVPRADGAVVEYVTMELPSAKPGSYRLFITVTDRRTGRSFTSHTPFAVSR